MRSADHNRDETMVADGSVDGRTGAGRSHSVGDPTRDDPVPIPRGIRVCATGIAVVVAAATVGVVLVDLVPQLLQAANVDPTDAPALAWLLARVVIVETVGMGGVALLALRSSGRSIASLDLHVPTRRDLRWALAGAVLSVGVSLVLGVAVRTLGSASSTHSLTELGSSNPGLLLAMIPISLLVVGPFEELLFRGVVQTHLRSHFDRVPAVGLASGLFSLIHFRAYATTDSLVPVLSSLVMLFAVSIVFGWVYERTDSLTIAGLTHGLYNAIVLAGWYLIAVSGVSVTALVP